MKPKKKVGQWLASGNADDSGDDEEEEESGGEDPELESSNEDGEMNGNGNGKGKGGDGFQLAGVDSDAEDDGEDNDDDEEEEEQGQDEILEKASSKLMSGKYSLRMEALQSDLEVTQECKFSHHFAGIAYAHFAKHRILLGPALFQFPLRN